MKRVHPRNTIKRINYENNKIINSNNSEEREKLKIKLNNLKTQISTKESNCEILKQKLTEIGSYKQPKSLILDFICILSGL